MSTADPDAHIRDLTKLIANDRVYDDQAGTALPRSQLVREMSTTGGPHLYSRFREIGRKYGRTSNSEKRARVAAATRFALPITLPPSRPERDIENRYNRCSSISRRWQLPALLSQCCRPREWQSMRDIRKTGGIKRALHCRAS